MPEQLLYLVWPVEWPVASIPVAAVWASEPAIARTKVRRKFKMPAGQLLRVSTCYPEGPIEKMGCPV
jgi:hypothetical protein